MMLQIGWTAVRTGLLWLLVLLGIATGMTKLIRLPAEMELFQGAGWGTGAILFFGAVQVAGAVLVALPGTRVFGCWIMIVTFAIASGVVWMAGMTGFFIFSLCFIALAALPLSRGPGGAK